MKNLTTKQIRIKVENKDYTDDEWNNFELWRFVKYKTNAYLLKGKIYYG